MAKTAFRKLAICLAASATVFGVGASALAGGYASFGYGSGYYGGHGYYAAGYSHHRGYRGHHRHHRRGGGGKGAAIALGVIGGAILLSEAARADERRRIEEERYYRDRYYRDRYERRRYESRDYDRDYIPQRDYETETDDTAAPSDDLDGVLDGGSAEEGNGPGPITISYRGAYETCKSHARKALGNRGFILAAPARPETAEDMGGAYRITATVMTENQRGESWSRAMYCEATDDRVYLLELI